MNIFFGGDSFLTLLLGLFNTYDIAAVGERTTLQRQESMDRDDAPSYPQYENWAEEKVVVWVVAAARSPSPSAEEDELRRMFLKFRIQPDVEAQPSSTPRE